MRFSSKTILSVSGASFTALLPTLSTNVCVVAAVNLDHELNSSASGSLRARTEIQDNDGHPVLESLLSREGPIKASSSYSDRTVSLQTGAECSIASSAKALDAASDVGILFSTCVDGEECVKDATSSLGGRCRVRFDKEGYIYGDAGVAEFHRERRLDGACSGDYYACIECTMVDGTAGKKCDGDNACENLNTTAVGCNSCNGLYCVS